MSTPTVEFGSLLTYAPRGTSQKASEAMTYLKNDKVTKSGILMSEYLARALKKEIAKLPFVDFFSPKATLVPAPRAHC